MKLFIELSEKKGKFNCILQTDSVTALLLFISHKIASSAGSASSGQDHLGQRPRIGFYKIYKIVFSESESAQLSHILKFKPQR